MTKILYNILRSIHNVYQSSEIWLKVQQTFCDAVRDFVLSVKMNIGPLKKSIFAGSILHPTARLLPLNRILPF